MNRNELADVRRGAVVAKKEFGLSRLHDGVIDLLDDRTVLLDALIAIENDTIVIENVESLRNKIRTTAAQAIVKATGMES